MVSLRDALPVWIRVALLSFGGPAGQIATMHRILVEEKRWIDEARFLHALNYCMLLPGPEAQQLATYLGWLMHGTRGGILAGGLFILPGAVAMMSLSWIYILYGHLGLVAGLLFGLKAAVLAIVLQAVVRIGRRALRTSVMQAIAVAAFVLIFFAAVPFPAIVLGAGLIGWMGVRSGLPGFQPRGGEAQFHPGGRTLPDRGVPSPRRSLRVAALWLALWLAPVATILATLGPAHVFSQIAAYFSTMALVSFGGAYAVLASVAQQGVETYHWLRPGEMLDGLGLAETTPGPLVLVLQFVGFLGAYRHPGGLAPLLAGTLGGVLTLWVTFTPCFLWIFLGAPYIERLRGNRALVGALSAITAAVVGVILNLAIWFAIHALFRAVRPVHAGPIRFDMPVPESVDPWALGLAGLAILAIVRLRIGMIATLAMMAGAGIALSLAGIAG